jgi:tRNA threonylcarbamoyladenosine biosynthesis protein TsaB
MKVLALELSTGRGSVAWLDQKCVERVWHNNRQNSGPLFENLKEMIGTSGYPEAIVVGLGPGSYAGVRIAISAAIGLQAACGARLVGLPSICAISCEARPFLVIGDARRQTFFLARVEENCLAESPELLSEAELRTRLDSRNSLPVLSSDSLPQFSDVRLAFPSAGQLAHLAAKGDCAFSLPPLEPMYLREPHITLPKIANRPASRS